MTNEEYAEYTRKHKPRSKIGRNTLRAFLCGGTICTFGQGLTTLYTGLGLEQEAAGTACSLSLILIGVVLTAFGVYDRIAKFAGAGSLVPITGFANSVAAPALEFKTEGYISGTAAKMFVIAGPVIVFGTSASVIYGLILCIMGAGA